MNHSIILCFVSKWCIEHVHQFLAFHLTTHHYFCREGGYFLENVLTNIGGYACWCGFLQDLQESVICSGYGYQSGMDVAASLTDVEGKDEEIKELSTSLPFKSF